MSIAIIIATHGVAAEQLLKTTEMLIGEQSDVATIDFVPGENAETIMGKYQEKLANELAHCDQVLFLVDTWGGSPFNAANRVSEGKENMDIVTGVNVPMLVETFMARDDGPSLSELVEVALETGRLGVRALRYQEKEEAPAVQPATAAQAPVQPQVAQVNQEGNLVIGLARIDDRLIHGQVATRWTKESRVSRIVVVNDDVAKDSVRSTMLKSVAPPGVTAHVVPVDKMIRVYNNPEYANERMMLLFTNPTDVVRLMEAGVEFKSINIGGMAYKDGKKMITSAVAVDDKDIEAFKVLDAKGIELDVRKVSNDSRQYMMDLLKKNNLI
ncbi:PTS mannose transporter subunit IIAB [Glaesserella parasuis]|uniref:PTS system mannose-specific EIIAB component n=3 Tax=Glaesserella parasuis TaxID=738 RepID=B8F7F0_GLAP5|nr:PTS mannose transporter subunit IIAB [Glaesserella parasuis]AGO17411.1 PTS system mannose-specific transporter subunits IIAB [Glaesserella parasuis ZJ0906]ACL33252.1 PTS system mannose-specific EIIAB component [Glaesserella parasuis SH0165]AIK18082.1 PTS mannose transporter subunit IIAB [Glaesserella parasuis]AWY44658.1 PTS mannose transporter subunit EIIAB [Glaesserella parasuis 29755]EMY46223.1 PTS system mannose-specific transporter subunits IIAB [Glaesserella parasuis gx033]